MLDAAAPYIKAKVLSYNCHRWAYTTPINPWYEPFYRNASLRLTLAGDSFGGPRIEGEALSGIQAASAIAD